MISRSIWLSGPRMLNRNRPDGVLVSLFSVKDPKGDTVMPRSGISIRCRSECPIRSRRQQTFASPSRTTSISFANRTRSVRLQELIRGFFKCRYGSCLSVPGGISLVLTMMHVKMDQRVEPPALLIAKFHNLPLTAICFTVTNHLRHRAIIGSEIHRGSSDASYQHVCPTQL
jgi:hypothetical protein